MFHPMNILSNKNLIEYKEEKLEEVKDVGSQQKGLCD